MAKLRAAYADDKLVHMPCYLADDLAVAKVERLETADIKPPFHGIHVRETSHESTGHNYLKHALPEARSLCETSLSH